MVKVIPSTAPIFPSAATPRPTDPTQSFEALLAATGQTDRQSAPETLAFGELGMLGRHGAVAGAETAPDVEASTTPPAAAASVSPPAAGVAAAAGRGAGAAEAGAPGSAPERAGAVARKSPDRALRSAPSGAPAQLLQIINGQTRPAVRSNASPPAKAATPPRPRPEASGQQAAPVRIDVSGPGAELHVVLAAPGLSGENRQRLRELLADTAAELGLRLAGFTLNGHIVDAPGVGALGASHGRIRG